MLERIQADVGQNAGAGTGQLVAVLLDGVVGEVDLRCVDVFVLEREGGD